MNHDDAFAEFRARRERERAAADDVRVTWRKARHLPGGGGEGYSGYGPGGVLLFVRRMFNYFEFGRIEKAGAASLLRPAGTGRTIEQAKILAEKLVSNRD